MTDDAELRARIEAQVAARRAGGSPPKGDRRSTEDGEEGGEKGAGDAGEGGPTALTPTRPWSRANTPPPPPATDEQPGRPGDGPLRPWLRRGVGPVEAPAPPPPPPPAPPRPASPTGLTPARPWHGQTEDTADDTAAEPPAVPVPSNPEIVLREMAAEAGEPAEPQLRRGRAHSVSAAAPPRRRRIRRRGEEDAAEGVADDVAAGSAPAADNAPAAYVPDAATVSAYVDAAPPVLDEPDEPSADEPDPPRRRRRRRPAELATEDVRPRHAARPPTAEPPTAEPPTAEPVVAPAALTADPAAPGLNGAPTWDPAEYQDEPEPGEAARSRRALRWLLERAPEPEPVPAAAPEVRPEPAAEPEPAATAASPGADLPRRLAEAAASAAEERPRDDPAADEPQPSAPKRSRLSRLLNRRPEEVEEDEPYEKFSLPEPDSSFERPWLRPTDPSPTREWSSERPVPAAPVILTKSEPPSRPSPGVRARPTPGATPGATPDPAPDPASPPERPRPSTAPRPTATPPPPAPPTPRPSIGISGSTDPERPAAHRAPPEGISGASSWGTTSSAGHSSMPDLAKFLEATEPQPDDDRADEEKAGPRVTVRARRMLVRTFVIVMIAAIAAVLLRAFVVQPYYIPSASMEPTLHGCGGCNDDHVLVDKLSYRAHDIREGDIIVFHRPPNAPNIPDKVLIKRVIGLPGDVVELKKGRVYVNGLVLDEPYVNEQCGANATVPLNGTSKWKVPGNDVFVMGDNRCHSDDSRAFGPIATSSVIGRAFAIIWPIGRMGLL